MHKIEETLLDHHADQFNNQMGSAIFLPVRFHKQADSASRVVSSLQV